jgi:hypothetical protein
MLDKNIKKIDSIYQDGAILANAVISPNNMKPASATPIPKRRMAKPIFKNPGSGAIITTMPKIKAAIPKIIAIIPTHLMLLYPLSYLRNLFLIVF